MTLADHAPRIMPTEWAYLHNLGWTIKPVNIPTGTARANHYNKTIEVKPNAYHKPTRRHIQYVLRHEIWHALHHATLNFNSDLIRTTRGLDLRSSLEALADGACQTTAPSRTMTLWVRASVTWHGRTGYHYRWADITSPPVQETIRHIQTQITTPATP